MRKSFKAPLADRADLKFPFAQTLAANVWLGELSFCPPWSDMVLEVLSRSQWAATPPTCIWACHPLHRLQQLRPSSDTCTPWSDHRSHDSPCVGVQLLLLVVVEGCPQRSLICRDPDLTFTCASQDGVWLCPPHQPTHTH